MDNLYQKISAVPDPQKYGLVGAIVLGIFAYYYFTIYSEAKAKVENAKKSAKMAAYSLDAQRRKLRETRKAKEELKEIENKSTDLDKRIPSSVDMSELVGELDQMADDMRILEIKPLDDDTSSYDSVVIKPISFKLQGRFHSLCRFLYKMFQMNRLMDVGDIVLKLAPVAAKDKRGSGPQHELVADFVARIYYSPGQKPTGSGGRSKEGLMKKGMKRLIKGPMVPTASGVTKSK